ncbi:fungal-specific transcription factor domain-containing protein [Zychaea mexicana]|uniref:fungal-specific transcription factor domain-containing protein n=1 Tax=Zychaea mexicana TaxID=64656 RepID=UPI0022FEDA34|nr:fungal-specific transcription factor domain-containing protein [Zychaea mexicana]KAI9488467.1 fungal-specific transcription factor domain-containing protein [Zychaea mexicana]
MEDSATPSESTLRTNSLPRLKIVSKSNASAKIIKTAKPESSTKRSCDNCRKRKVRCDSVGKNTCNQCRRSGVDCQYLWEPKKTGPPTKQYTESLERRIQMLEQLLEEERKKNNEIFFLTAPTATSVAAHLSAVVDQVDNITSSIDNLLQYDPALDATTTWDIKRIKDINFIGSSPVPPIGMTQNSDPIRAIPNLTPELAERMMTAYFDHLHQKCAILDKRAFLIQYYYQYPQPLEKHLLQAVCAVGAQFLPRRPGSTEFSVVRMVGRHLRENAMKVMEVAYKRSSISTLQTLVLMALLAPNSDYGEGSSTNWLILGAAIHMSLDLGLHSEALQRHLPKSEIELRRRLVYIIYALEKISAASSERPCTLKDEDFDVELPSLYEIEPEDRRSIQEYSINGSIPKLLEDVEADIREKRQVYNSFSGIIDVARMIAHVLASFYVAKPASRANIALISNVDASIMTWQINRESNYTEHEKALLQILYNGLLLLRYRPLFLVRQRTGVIDDNQSQVLALCSRIAANIIDFVEASPVLGVPCLKDYMVAQSASIFLKNCNNEDDAVRLQARRNLARCANLYMRDDIVNQCQNAVVLDELAKQLSEEEASRQSMQKDIDASLDSTDHLSMIFQDEPIGARTSLMSMQEQRPNDLDIQADLVQFILDSTPQ